jgi:tripartite-type tricarboxylate transporter receptor subunit TctC
MQQTQPKEGALSSRNLLALTVLSLACIISSTEAQGVADFYKGRTVYIIVGFGPGGGYDLYGRVLGRHLGAHIPGRPSVTVAPPANLGR